MAKKNSTTGFRDILASIKKKEFVNTYILMGEESYYIDILADALEENVVSNEDRDFNAMTFYGADADMPSVIGSAQQYPVMADRVLVMLKEAQSMFNGKNQLEKLASYVEKPNKTTVLVIVWKGEPLPERHPLLKKGRAAGAVVFTSNPVKDYQLSGPITDYCSSKGFGVDPKAMQLLIDYIGNPLSKLFGEIDKLILSSPTCVSRITPDLIEKNIGISKDFNTFELLKAIAVRDYPRAMMIIEFFSKNPKQNPGVVVVALLFGFFSKLFIATVTRDKSDESLMAALDIRTAYSLKDYREALRRYNAKQAYAAIHSIREYDAHSKGIGSTQNEYELLKELIFKIFTA